VGTWRRQEDNEESQKTRIDRALISIQIKEIMEKESTMTTEFVERYKTEEWSEEEIREAMEGWEREKEEANKICEEFYEEFINILQDFCKENFKVTKERVERNFNPEENEGIKQLREMQSHSAKKFFDRIKGKEIKRASPGKKQKALKLIKKKELEHLRNSGEASSNQNGD